MVRNDNIIEKFVDQQIKNIPVVMEKKIHFKIYYNFARIYTEEKYQKFKNFI